ncbi:2-C-methyl-D-erythritol 4-phosphate cytidylyltransferase [Niallia sp. NCCP-28]|uniref:2-C-methyl-D-erythritol 4-phosphate cytidylyltransferase n=1 Tax=Niallia sp. NCCP-28 TaxID=2934712 RepID=UPI00208B0C6F|nr:2-C-methyl-D-erythritol 4-phosphate cytidylyltransferase [Niallia sp. NCCP-28]GKU84921.1 2-C-methyl-D-erythritol 4-phosphate cytidylyltransferase [Niallia sp. NCCP-28]
MAYEVIIPAAGQGKRMQAGKNKLFLTIDDSPIFIHTLQVFEQDSDCTRIWLVINPEEKQQMQEWIAKFDIQKIAGLVDGGIERQYSIYNAMKLLGNNGIVLVHDAARPFINKNQIKQLIEVAKENGAAVLAVPIKDTVKKVSGGIVEATVDRSSLWAIQTPQAFRISILKEAYEQALQDDFFGTDDASLVERLGKEVKIVLGDYDNIKLTTPEDLYFAEAIMQKRKKVNEKE